jgi:hypothetical protein
MENINKHNIPACLRNSELFKMMDKDHCKTIPVSKKYYFPLLNFLKKFNNGKKKNYSIENDVPKKRMKQSTQSPRKEKLNKSRTGTKKKRKISEKQIKPKKMKIDSQKDVIVNTSSVDRKKKTTQNSKKKSKRKLNIDNEEKSSFSSRIMKKMSTFNMISIREIINEISEQDISPITTKIDFREIINILRYWMVYEVPFEVYEYIQNNVDEIEKNKTLVEFNDFPYIDELNFVLETSKQEKNSTFNKDMVTAKIARYGYLNLIKYYVKKGYTLSDYVCKIAAYENDFEMFKFACENGAKITDDVRTVYNKKELTSWGSYLQNLNYCNIGSRLATYGNLNFLKYVHDKKYSLKSLCIGACAAEHGHINILKYLREIGSELGEWTVAMAARNGYLNCIKHLHSVGCSMGRFSGRYAAQHGFMDCVIFIYNHGGIFDYNTIGNAARHGHLDILKYLHTKGCPLTTVVLSGASSNGHLDCVKYANEHECPRSKYCIEYAVQNDHKDMLEYLCENDFPLSENACHIACKKNHLESLKILHKYGCKLSVESCHYAAKYNSLKCLEYLYKNNCK